MKIRFEDYLSENERKQIIKDVFVEKVKQDAERIFSNTAYDVVFKAVNESLNGEAEKLIAEKTIQVINELTSYTVFRDKDIYDREKSAGRKALDWAINENKEVLKARIKQMIDQIPEENLSEIVSQEMQNLLDAKLFNTPKTA